MDYSKFILPFKNKITLCPTYCYDVNRETVDLFDHVLSNYWDRIIDYIKDSIFDINGNHIKQNRVDCIKYILYQSSVDPDFDGIVVCVLKDEYNLIINGNKTNMFILYINQSMMKCELGDNFNK